jgi:signal transduction histidine kinase
MAAWLLHHSVTGLRESLQEARQRSDELARKRDELQVEMQARERSRDQLVHAMKMDNVGRLASGIAHDFNHLLALIQGYVAKARRSEGEALHAALQGADSATRRASAVSRRLLDFSRLDPGRPQLLDAAATLAAVAPTLQQVFGERVQCEVETGDVRRLIHFDPAQLESILLSLAVNASHAMPDGGRFTLRLQPPDSDGRLVLQLQDTGQGMTEAVRARCLEPFFTTNPVGQGTGLGLAVTASLVEAAGGAVQVHSRPGEGTRIDLQLPSRPLAA